MDAITTHSLVTRLTVAETTLTHAIARAQKDWAGSAYLNDMLAARAEVRQALSLAEPTENVGTGGEDQG